jgi:adenylate kinase
MQVWIATGISGSGRIELLEELATYTRKHLGKECMVHDIGKLIHDECKKNHIPVVDKRILDMDQSQLCLLRALAIKDVKNAINQNTDVDLHLIGIHATFRGNGRLIPGISFQNLSELNLQGLITDVTHFTIDLTPDPSPKDLERGEKHELGF